MYPDPLLIPYLTYKEENHTIAFKDYHGSEHLVGEFLEVRFTITDSLGNKFESAQMIKVQSNDDSLDLI